MASDGDRGLESFGRYADPALVVMTSLSAGPRHGYAIIQDVVDMGGPRLRPGTLYAVLARLEERGLIEALEPDERRRPYRLTGAGAAALRVQLEHLQRVAERGLARLQAATA
ncbi:MAG TPA: helix-turn-helix transcriptional regulator [Gaiellales bacterium]|nr:helix-turn-helix transcriptional regulator [Gaiellales bacterium]